ncbi:30S ribosomal protein S15 [Candidatus Peregrinibacteria bacterium]|nr:MAG: 30S ribosomal protein S15 [Candidatus Peregrinibacteria bacterium]
MTDENQKTDEQESAVPSTTKEIKTSLKKDSPKEKKTSRKKEKVEEVKAPSGRIEKKEVISAHSRHQKDTGSISVQVALLTEKINHLTDHLRTHPKDDHGRRGLMSSVGKRRKLLKYLKDRSKDLYEELIQKLGLRH